MAGSSARGRLLVGVRIDTTSHADAAERVLGWARAGESRYVCAATVHMVMEAHDDPAFRAVVNGADLVTPDGMPLLWGVRLLGEAAATRVRGTDLMSTVCARAGVEGIPIGLYGSTPQVLDRLADVLPKRFPGLRIAYRVSPPFRPLAPSEDEEVVRAIHASGARVLFVGLGCPKQERWMAAHRGRVHLPMVGVGAAFDFLAGVKREAPRWMQNAGLEWSFRLLSEPRRLWRRYAYHNPRFVALLAVQLCGRGRRSRGAR